VSSPYLQSTIEWARCSQVDRRRNELQKNFHTTIKIQQTLQLAARFRIDQQSEDKAL
jgi:hypothetical protein